MDKFQQIVLTWMAVLVFVVAVIGAFFTGLPSIVQTYYGCQYADDYYSNDSFWMDINRLKTEGRNNGLNCKQIAPTAMCLCDKYNMTCKPYTLFGYGFDNMDPNILGMFGHVGTHVWDDGRWVMLT